MPVRGWPAVGLLLLRVALGLTLTLSARRPPAHAPELIGAVLLAGGAWTQAAGTLVAAVEIWRIIAESGGWVSLLLTTIAVALVLIGPGVWSLDAKVFGWRRIDIPPRAKRHRDS